MKLHLINNKAINKVGLEFKYRLKPLISDDNVYKKIISDEDLGKLSEEEKTSKVYLNYNYIKEFLKNILNKFTSDEIMQAISKFEIVIIPLNPETDDAQQIFESINAYGMPLSSVDLIRNCILMNLLSDQQDMIYLHYWKHLENIFSKDQSKMQDCFRFYISSKNYELPKKEEVYSEFARLWKNNKNDFTKSIQMLKEIIEYAEAFDWLYFDDSINIKGQNEFNEVLLDFKKINSITLAPYINSICMLYKENSIKEKVQIKKMYSFFMQYLLMIIDTYKH